jgi:hypothetical protein
MRIYLYICAALGILLMGVGCKATKPAAVLGCVDPNAGNYNPRATKDDGSCLYDFGNYTIYCAPQDLARLRLGMNKHEVQAALGVFPYEIYGADNGCEVHVYQVKALRQKVEEKGRGKTAYKSGDTMFEGRAEKVHVYFDAGKLTSVLTEKGSSGLAADLACLANDMSKLCNLSAGSIVFEGCMDPTATNYDKVATRDNGSCAYVKGCTDATAANYNKNAIQDDGSCRYVGCTDERAVNYNPDALHNQSKCKYCPCDTQDFYYIMNSNPGCADPCVKVKRDPSFTGPQNQQCTWCELFNQAGPANVQIQLDGVRVNK